MFKTRHSDARGKVIAVLLALSVLTVACSSHREIRLDKKDSGRQIEIKEGQTLAITLQANPTTGYLWEVVECDQSILAQAGEPDFQPQSHKIGAPGEQTLHFDTRKSGNTTLTLVYHRPWEKEVAPLETFSLRLMVR